MKSDDVGSLIKKIGSDMETKVKSNKAKMAMQLLNTYSLRTVVKVQACDAMMLNIALMHGQRKTPHQVKGLY
jgi:peroxiredoxin family protein